MTNDQSRRASESTGCTMRPNRVSFSRTTSEISVSQKEHEMIRRASQTSAASQTRQFAVISGSPISKESRYRRSPSPRIIPSRCSSAQSSPSPCTEKDPFSTWIAAFQPLGGRKAARCFREANVNPPISKSSLGELEVGCIITNPKLRHDINFDRELHFRPNLDGERGRRKLLTAEEYWVALEPELEKYSYMLSDARGVEFRWSSEWLAEFRSSQKRIPRLFNTIKDILITLTPDQEVPSADEALDVPLIMQQIERGVYDLSSLATWLAALLKAHCAPMRDQWVERMVELLSRGGTTFNAKLIVDGLKELFGIMEAMKLDIANHQIRYFRPILLENTIAFEQKYYAARIAEGQVDIRTARTWLSNPETVPESSSPDLTSFIYTYLSSLLSPNPTLPETFTLDHDRLLVLRCDAHSLIYTDICLAALSRLLEAHNRPTLHSTRASAYLRSVIPLIVGRAASDARWSSKAGAIAVEIVRAALGRFPNTTSSDAATVNQQMEAPAEEEELAVDGAAVCADLEAYLQRHLHADSELFALRVAKLRARLVIRVTHDARHLEKLSLREVCEAMLGPRTAAATAAAHHATPQSLATGTIGAGSKPSSRTSKASIPADVESQCGADSSAEAQADAAYEDIVARLTHIAVLHWRVWAPLVYLRGVGDDIMDWQVQEQQ